MYFNSTRIHKTRKKWLAEHNASHLMYFETQKCRSLLLLTELDVHDASGSNLILLPVLVLR